MGEISMSSPWTRSQVPSAIHYSILPSTLPTRRKRHVIHIGMLPALPSTQLYCSLAL